MRMLLCISIVVAMMLGTSTLLAAEEGQSADRAAMQKQLREISHKIGKLQRDVIKENPELADLSKQIKELQAQFNEKLAAASPELAQLMKERDDLRKKAWPQKRRGERKRGGRKKKRAAEGADEAE